MKIEEFFKNTLGEICIFDVLIHIVESKLEVLLLLSNKINVIVETP